MEQNPKISKKTDITAGLIRDVAIMAAAGSPKTNIQKKFNATPFIINEILAMPDCQAVINEINQTAIDEAKTTIKQGMSGLAKEAVRVVADNLKRNNLEAAKMVLRSLGLEQEKDTGQNNSFQLVLATTPTPEKTITVKEDNSDAI